MNKKASVTDACRHKEVPNILTKLLFLERPLDPHTPKNILALQGKQGRIHVFKKHR